MKIAYIGIDLFYTALETLEKLGCEIMEIFTCQTDNVTEFNLKVTGFAQLHSIPCNTERITVDDIERLIKNGCEAAICGGYYFKIPSNTKLPMVNIHPSLLPIGRGSWPMAQAILWGHKKSGVTIHKIAEGFDTGDILMQKEFDLTQDETHKTFMAKANGLLPQMLAELVANFEELYKNAVPQTEGEYWTTPKESDYTITPDMTANEADRILRAFYGYECIYSADGRKTTIIGGRAVASNDTEQKSFVLSDGYINARNDNFI